MNRFLLIIIFLKFYLINDSLFAQVHVDTVRYVTHGTNSSGKRGNQIYHMWSHLSFAIHPQKGFNKVFRTDGSLYMKGSFSAGSDSVLVKCDSFFYYYTNGQLSDCGVYNNNARISTWEHYNSMGVLEYKQDYCSFMRTYYYPDGSKQAEGKMCVKGFGDHLYEFSDLTEHTGLWNFYYPNGSCECRGELFKNTKHKKWTYYTIDHNKAKVSVKRYKQYSVNYTFSFLYSCKWQ